MKFFASDQLSGAFFWLICPSGPGRFLLGGSTYIRIFFTSAPLTRRELGENAVSVKTVGNREGKE